MLLSNEWVLMLWFLGQFLSDLSEICVMNYFLGAFILIIPLHISFPLAHIIDFGSMVLKFNIDFPRSYLVSQIPWLECFFNIVFYVNVWMRSMFHLLSVSLKLRYIWSLLFHSSYPMIYTIANVINYIILSLLCKPYVGPLHNHITNQII